MIIQRHVLESLTSWKLSKNRKPLILRGARQVGKTTIVKEFAKSYQHALVLNLEKASDIEYFNLYNNVNTILDALFIKHNIAQPNISQTLLFIDEIQESPKAIQMLRFFYEEIPDLHVIAAGSLLEFAIKHVGSFPVGRVEYMYMHPLSFQEYLQALGKHMLLEQLSYIPINDFAHQAMLEQFHLYAIIGGMPEVVKVYLEQQNISSLARFYESLWESFRNDAEKYSNNETEQKVLKHIFSTAHGYVDQRIKFQNFGNSNYRSREVGEAFRNLDSAKIIQLIYPTTELHPPAIQNVRKSPRLQFLDTGLLNYTLGIQAQMLAMSDYNAAYRGAITHHITNQELIALNTFAYEKPLFWVRDKNQASSEIDVVVSRNGLLFPIEVKSGVTGTLRSLHQFINLCDHSYAIRLYAGNFKVEKAKTPAGKPYLLMNLPYYLVSKIESYIDYFVSNYKI